MRRSEESACLALRVSGREVDVRVSIIPMMHGEGVVMRLSIDELTAVIVHESGEFGTGTAKLLAGKLPSKPFNSAKASRWRLRNAPRWRVMAASCA